jgi:hypothetical protein
VQRRHHIQISHRDGVQRHGCLVQRSFTRSRGHAESLTTSGNAKLYVDTGIQAAIAALRPGGLVIYWSADADPAFVKALRRNGLTVTTAQSHAHGKHGAPHALIAAEKRR